MNHVFIRSEARRGVMVGTMAVPEQLPNGSVSIVAMGVIAVGAEWTIRPVGDTVLLVGENLDWSDTELEQKYPPIPPPVVQKVPDLVVPAAGMRLIK